MRVGVWRQEVWEEVLRCVSRWELLQQVHSGGPTDALLFAQPGEAPGSTKRKPLSFFSLRASPAPPKADGGVGRFRWAALCYRFGCCIASTAAVVGDGMPSQCSPA